MKVCSLFSGIGGIDIGFMQAGFEIAWANEFDRDAARTYRHNFGNEHLVEKDIRKVDVATIPDFDVLVAGFPCQPFSILGKQRGFEDSRGMLFYEIERVVKAKRPQVIFLENVANLIEHDDGKTFLTVYNTLVPYGYSFRYRVMDAIDYGNVPQHRTRIFIVAFLDNDKCERFEFPEKLKRTTKLNDIINRSEKHDNSYYYTEANEYFEDLNRVAKDKQALYRIFENGVSAKPYYVCPTLVASMGAFMHRVPVLRDDYGIRIITPYECLALQGFPKDFRFPKIPMASAYKQCGNSVVVPVIRRIAENILKVLIEGE
jgi:DNA (cytosine-5)-methyltransferase 1